MNETATRIDPVPDGGRLVVVGGGMAAMRFAERLHAEAPHRFKLTILGAEPHKPYNRVLLSQCLAGEVATAEIGLCAEDWFDKAGIDFVAGETVIALDRKGQKVTCQSGRAYSFDRCILATGSAPFRLPIPGHELAGVETFRDLQDLERLAAGVGPGAPAVVIGGGLLGLEAAYGLSKLGAQVTVLHLMDRLMERQLDARGADHLLTALKALGLRVILEAESAAFKGERRVSAVQLKSGEELAADLVVMAVGVRPATRLAVEAGLTVERAIVVDDYLQTSDPTIFAIGECAQHRGIAYGLVEPVYEQAAALAKTLAGHATPYCGSVCATSLKVAGVDVFSAGSLGGAEGADTLLYDAPADGVYRRLTLTDNRLEGCVLVGSIAEGPFYRRLINEGRSVAAFRSDLLFGEAYIDAEALKEPPAAEPQEAERPSLYLEPNQPLPPTQKEAC
ncbi:MAG: FAD-dependent oxidoreductase [Pseudomonadota bacterium]